MALASGKKLLIIKATFLILLFSMMSVFSETTTTLKLSLSDAILTSLEKNKNLKIQRYNPKINEQNVIQSKAKFDPTISIDGSLGETRSQVDDPVKDTSVSRNRKASASVGGKVETGATYSLSTSLDRNSSKSAGRTYSADYQLRVTQSLLKGFGLEVNLADIKMSENRYKISKSVFRNTLIDFVSQIKKAYWNLYLAAETVRIREEALKVAKEQTALTNELVRLGKTAEIELLSSQAEEASRYSSLIDARSNLANQNLQFIRLLSPSDDRSVWDLNILTSDMPDTLTEQINVSDHVEVAIKNRPDLEQAELDLKNGELEVVQTKNGLLPKLDYFGSVGSDGKEEHLDDAYGTASELKYRSWSTGFEFSYPLMNRAARAQYKKAKFANEQAVESISNLKQQIELEVRQSVIEIKRTEQQIQATKATKRLSQEALRAEKEKFRVGRSTNLLVSQAQRDLIQAEINEVNAIISNMKAYIDLYTVEGSLLEREGLSVKNFE